MATTTTPALGLVKPTPGTAEPYSLVFENTNKDIIDTAIGPKTIKTTTTTRSNSTSELSLVVSSIGDFVVGSTWRAVFWGTFDAASIGAAGTLIWRVKFGGVTVATITITLPNTTAQTNQPWRLELELICITLGSPGTFRAAVNGATSNNNALSVQMAIPTATISVSTGSAQNIDFTQQFSVANAGHIIRCDGGYIERVSNA